MQPAALAPVAAAVPAAWASFPLSPLPCSNAPLRFGVHAAGSDGDGKREVREFCRREPQRTGAEVAARAAIGVRIFQHVREVGHGANFSTARPLPRLSVECPAVTSEARWCV